MQEVYHIIWWEGRKKTLSEVEVFGENLENQTSLLMIMKLAEVFGICDLLVSRASLILMLMLMKTLSYVEKVQISDVNCVDVYQMNMTVEIVEMI